MQQLVPIRFHATACGGSLQEPLTAPVRPTEGHLMVEDRSTNRRGVRQAMMLPATGDDTSCCSSATRAAVLICACLALLTASSSPASAADLSDCRKMLIAGQYDDCIRTAKEAIDKRSYGEDWRILKARAEITVGRYEDAWDTIEAALKRYSWSVRLRMLGHQASLHTGEDERATKMLSEVSQLVENSPWRYSNVDDLVVLGHAAIIFGADARSVLEGFFDRAKKASPSRREPWIASGNLALDKHDHQLAADIFSEAVKKFPDDPDVNFGLARAYAPSETQLSIIAADKVLKANPNHIPMLLFQADKLIDSEKYAEAGELTERILAINPSHPEAWSLRAVMSHLDNDPRGEVMHRAIALGTWSGNPVVDHTIGRKLSQKYRFAEGAAYQRRALEFDDEYIPARVQLAQDLLRLGNEDEGWQLAASAYEADEYDVATFNLLELRDELSKFETIETDDFILRMDPREAAIYGRRVIDLLTRAKTTLCEKYGLELAEPVTVEIFPDENDFGVRTFGIPGVPGFLGVCFGRVITANSPASQSDHPSNWESVLWHEFCHVVTLQLTLNKMPRWLSEGISVYEELQEDPRWGQRMNPGYRRMILEGELTPVGQLSSAFLSPKSPVHLQFAYFQASLVVEHIVDEFGLEALKLILRDLGRGVSINDALGRHTNGLDELETAFEEFAKQKAEGLAPGVDWEDVDIAAIVNTDSDTALADYVRDHPNNFKALSAYAAQLIEAERFEEAKPPLYRLLALYPDYAEGDSAYAMLAVVHRELDDVNGERSVLQQFADRSADGVPQFLRLLELHTENENWPGVLDTGRRLFAVNPLIPEPHRRVAEAAEQLDRPQEGIAAWRTLLAMEPNDPAEVNFRLARLLHSQGDALAKRHVLQALEEAPRFRSAHRLLLKIRSEEPPSAAEPGSVEFPDKGRADNPPQDRRR